MKTARMPVLRPIPSRCRFQFSDWKERFAQRHTSAIDTESFMRRTEGTNAVMAPEGKRHAKPASSNGRATKQYGTDILSIEALLQSKAIEISICMQATSSLIWLSPRLDHLQHLVTSAHFDKWQGRFGSWIGADSIQRATQARGGASLVDKCGRIATVTVEAQTAFQAHHSTSMQRGWRTRLQFSSHSLHLSCPRTRKSSRRGAPEHELQQ